MGEMAEYRKSHVEIISSQVAEISLDTSKLENKSVNPLRSWLTESQGIMQINSEI